MKNFLPRSVDAPLSKHENNVSSNEARMCKIMLMILRINIAKLHALLLRGVKIERNFYSKMPYCLLCKLSSVIIIKEKQISFEKDGEANKIEVY